jgi:hypothetical protein
MKHTPSSIWNTISCACVSGNGGAFDMYPCKSPCSQYSMEMHRLPRLSYQPKNLTKHRSYYCGIVSICKPKNGTRTKRRTLGCENFAIVSSSRVYLASLVLFRWTAIFFTARTVPFCVPLVHVSNHTLPKAPPPIWLSCFHVSSLRTARWREERLESK